MYGSIAALKVKRITCAGNKKLEVFIPPRGFCEGINIWWIVYYNAFDWLQSMFYRDHSCGMQDILERRGRLVEFAPEHRLLTLLIAILC